MWHLVQRVAKIDADVDVGANACVDVDDGVTLDARKGYSVALRERLHFQVEYFVMEPVRS